MALSNKIMAKGMQGNEQTAINGASSVSSAAYGVEGETQNGKRANYPA